MLKNISKLIVLPLLLSLIMMGCVVHNSASEEGKFEWDMSVENHTGTSKNLYAQDGKHRGMSVFNWRSDIDESINQLVKNNIEWVALVPYLYQRTDTTKVIRPRTEIGTWTRRDSAYIRVINKIHAREMNVMLKPHLWMSEGWRSDISLDNDEEWDIWFESYRRHMIHYAMLAEHLDVGLYCIGAEFKSSIMTQPDKWDTLIKEIKTIYKGKLTYAANWDAEYKEVKFWDQMDYIGIQAYFPLTNKRNPSLNEIKDGWKRHMKMLEKLSQKYDKPILFSETGYRSDETATIKPWVWGSALDKTTDASSNMTQNLAYEALFQQLWNKDWFAGMYFWQWHNRSVEGESREKMDFTPRFKPAENTMAKWYGRRD